VIVACWLLTGYGRASSLLVSTSALVLALAHSSGNPLLKLLVI
jgi:hypothetical protein